MKTIRLNQTIRSKLKKEANRLILMDPHFIDKKEDLLKQYESLHRFATNEFKNYVSKEDEKTLNKYDIYVKEWDPIKNALNIEKVFDALPKLSQGRFAGLSICAGTGTQYFNSQRHFSFIPKETIRYLKDFIFLKPEHPFWKDFDRYDKELKNLNDWYHKKQKPYDTVIRSSNTNKQVLEVWPEAEKFEFLVQRTTNVCLPVAVSLSDKQAIQKDMQIRQGFIE